MHSIWILARRRLTALAFAGFAVGCTTHVTVNPIELPEAHGASIPASIGVYYPPEFAHYPVHEQLSEDYESIALETDIGPASRSIVDATLRAAFDAVSELDAPNPPDLVARRIQAVAIPRIAHFDYAQLGGTTRVAIGYILELTHRDGRTVALAVEARHSDEPDGPAGFELLGAAAAEKIESAMRAAAAKLWFRLNAVAGEEDWFAALHRLSLLAREEIQGRLAPSEGRCVLFIFLEELGYYDEFADNMQGAVLSGDVEQRWLPDASRFVRYDLLPGEYTIQFGAALLMKLMPEVYEPSWFKIECEAGRSYARGLRFWTGGEMRAAAIPLEFAASAVGSRTDVSDDKRVAPDF